MGKVRAGGFAVSLDGFAAGPRQDGDHPLGVRGEELMTWVFKTRFFHEMTGQPGGTTDTDDQFARKSMDNLGAWIMGRNMFGPVRGPWPDHSWKGWWGNNPPYHTPVFVLTHYPRPSIEMDGGTIFHFVTDGVVGALDGARAVANGKDIRIGGGVSVIRQYLQARLLDELHLVVSPVFLGSGEHLFSGLDMQSLGYVCTESVPTPNATHVFARRIT